MITQGMPPSLAKRFRSGRACLDFVHTGGAMDWVEPELLRDTISLQRWLAHVLELVGVQAQDGDIDAAYRLRDALWCLVRARTEGRELAQGHIETLNAFAAVAPPVPQLTPKSTLASSVVPAAAALSAIARDGVDLLAGPLGHRIRVCEDADCAFLFVDASRPGTRRWCSMQRCGNLAKTRTHRAATAPTP